MDRWEGFATVTGSTAGVVIGILFIAVSVISDANLAGPAKNRIAPTLAMFYVALLLSIVLLIPGQNRFVLGAEVLFFAAAYLAGPWVAKNNHIPVGPGYGDGLPTGMRFNATLIVGAGLTLLFDLTPGLYVLAAAIVANLGGGLGSVLRLLFETKNLNVDGVGPLPHDNQ